MAERTRLLEVKDDRTLTMPGARLVVLRGPDKGRAVRLEAEQTVVGTGQGAHLQLTDETVSRSHLSLRVTPDGYVMEDLGSTNGSRVDGRRVTSAYVAPGDRITLGKTQLRLEAQREAVDLTLSVEHGFGRLIGRSLAARRLFAVLEQVAAEETTTLLWGETGTGKDAAAEAIHEASRRAAGPFTVVDCSALVGSLMESELFGHEKGAFTGALSARVGAFEEAAGGTLFLDEIGELPRALQPKLLRVLERREVRPVGSQKARPVDVRILAATNRELGREVNQGTFREDLYYRLNVISVRLPPLRERAEDVPLLAECFWREVTGDPSARLPEALLTELRAHLWPGNVRELRNRVERAAVLDRGALAAVVPPARSSYRAGKAAAVAAFERAFLSELLARARGNVSEGARLAGMDRAYLTKLIRKYRA